MVPQLDTGSYVDLARLGEKREKKGENKTIKLQCTNIKLGIGASVSGAGASVGLVGSILLSDVVVLESSLLYEELRPLLRIPVGIKGLYGWLLSNNNLDKYRAIIRAIFKDLSTLPKQDVRVNVELEVKGSNTQPNRSVSANIAAFKIILLDGSTVLVVSRKAATIDIRAQDQNGNEVNAQDNKSTIEAN